MFRCQINDNMKNVICLAYLLIAISFMQLWAGKRNVQVV